MPGPHRTAAGPSPRAGRCGPASGVHALGPRERRAGVGIAVSLGALLAASAVTLSTLPAVPSDLVGRRPSALAVSVASIEPTAPPPRRITVERLGIDHDLIGLGLDRGGALQVPEDPSVPGWYRDGVPPGGTGPAVLVGHVDSFDGPGIFFRLREAVPGDRVTVTRIDRSVVTFEVYGVETVRKDGFPTEQVYGGTQGPELRLLTCGGPFDQQTRSYTENVVVYARQV